MGRDEKLAWVTTHTAMTTGKVVSLGLAGRVAHTMIDAFCYSLGSVDNKLP